MRIFRAVCLPLCLAGILLFFMTVCAAEDTLRVEDRGMDLTDTVSIHYPAVAGLGDGELEDRVNSLIRTDCGAEEYLSRAALLISGGSLRVEWQGDIAGDIFRCAVSAAGSVRDSRTTHVWTASVVDLRDGHEVAFDELFTDAKAARELIGEYLDMEVAPELSAHLQNSELTPLPERFYPESTGLTLLYPVEQLSTLSDRAGDIRIPWHVLRDALDLADGGIPDRLGVKEMITLSERSAEELRTMAAEGRVTGIPAAIGNGMQELTDRYHLLTSPPDRFEGGRLFSLEGGCFRGVYLISDDLDSGWTESRLEGIRLETGCLWGLCVGETTREEWLAVLGEADGTAQIDADKAELIRLEPGTCDYYGCGDYQLRLYGDEDGTLICVVLAE